MSFRKSLYGVVGAAFVGAASFLCAHPTQAALTKCPQFIGHEGSCTMYSVSVLQPKGSQLVVTNYGKNGKADQTFQMMKLGHDLTLADFTVMGKTYQVNLACTKQPSSPDYPGGWGCQISKLKVTDKSHKRPVYDFRADPSILGMSDQDKRDVAQMVVGLASKFEKWIPSQVVPDGTPYISQTPVPPELRARALLRGTSGAKAVFAALDAE